jgi:serine phosphatase RsbU (regulator of sigma subunit)
VEDGKVNQMLLSRELKSQGYQFGLAENGKHALEKLSEEEYDLILLDVEMPEMDGYQTLAALKANKSLFHLPVIMVTSVDDMASAVHCIEMGAEDYLPKPFNPVLLRARVGASLEKKRLRDQEQAYLKALERELEIGHDIQLSFLPPELPQIPGWEIAASLEAAREVAGDFYDAFPLNDDEIICLVIGDVCDKGVGAALFMTLFRSLLRFTLGATNAFGEPSSAAKLKNAVTLTNYYIADTHGDSGMFATIFLGLLDVKKSILTYINAGHEPPVVVSEDGTTKILKSTGMSVGIIPDWEFKVEQIPMEAGDLLFAFTDGAPEMNNPAGEFFGKDKLLSLIANSQKSASTVIEKVNQALVEHLGSGNQFDDITLMALKKMNS